jgi:hypothetical protein
MAKKDMQNQSTFFIFRKVSAKKQLKSFKIAPTYMMALKTASRRTILPIRNPL